MEQDRRSSDNLNNAILFLSRNALRAGRLFASPFAWPFFIAVGSISFFTIIIMVLFLGGAGLGAEIPQDTSKTSSQGGASTKFNTYFCQGALKWQSGCDLGTNGCTPTSMAMIMNSFGINITPREVAINYFDRAGCDGATNFDNYKSRIASLGFRIEGDISKDDPLYGGKKLIMKEAENFLKSGYLILAASGPYKCFPSNKCAGREYIETFHEFVITNVDIASNTITIRDPNSCSYASFEDVEDSQYNTRELIYSNFGKFLHAYPIKKT